MHDQKMLKVVVIEPGYAGYAIEHDILKDYVSEILGFDVPGDEILEEFLVHLPGTVGFQQVLLAQVVAVVTVQVAYRPEGFNHGVDADDGFTPEIFSVFHREYRITDQLLPASEYKKGAPAGASLISHNRQKCSVTEWIALPLRQSVLPVSPLSDQCRSSLLSVGEDIPGRS